ncbi:hypothetical protein RI367_002273 [Sorochytrium milnesiophthora]
MDARDSAQGASPSTGEPPDITPEQLAVDTGYLVPGCPTPYEQTPTSAARMLTGPSAKLAQVPPGPVMDTVMVSVQPAQEEQSNKDKKQTALVTAQPSESEMPSAFSTLSNLLEANRKWAERMNQKKPGFFGRLAAQQAPQLLWIGCSDSRVPANQIVNLEPGEVFVHRNVANVVLHTDLNSLSVLQYAVDVLKVKHVIVCGHYGCGGVLASMTSRQYGLIDNWIRGIKDLYAANLMELDSIADMKQRADLLCELNVAQSVRNVCATTIIQNAWARDQEVSVHGWCYRIDDGLIRDLDICVSNQSQVQKIYAMVDEKVQTGMSRQSTQEVLQSSNASARRRSTVHGRPKNAADNTPPLAKTPSNSRLLRTYSISGSTIKSRARSLSPTGAQRGGNSSDDERSDTQGDIQKEQLRVPGKQSPNKNEQVAAQADTAPDDGNKQRSRRRTGSASSRNKSRENAVRSGSGA